MWVSVKWLTKWMKDCEGPPTLEDGKDCWVCWPFKFLPCQVHDLKNMDLWQNWDLQKKITGPTVILRPYQLQSVLYIHFHVISFPELPQFLSHLESTSLCTGSWIRGNVRFLWDGPSCTISNKLLDKLMLLDSGPYSE